MMKKLYLENKAKTDLDCGIIDQQMYDENFEKSNSHFIFNKYKHIKNVDKFLQVRKNILRRLPFEYSYKDYLLTSLFKTCKYCKKCIKHPEDLKKYEMRRKMFDRARSQMMKDLDITKLIYKLQKFTIMKQIILKSH